MASLLRSGCVGAFLCGEADEEALWLASLLKSGGVGTVLCGEADEGVLWLVSLKGSWLRCGGCVFGFCGFWGVIFVVLYGLGYSVGISFAFEGDVLYLCMDYT